MGWGEVVGGGHVEFSSIIRGFHSCNEKDEEAETESGTKHRLGLRGKVVTALFS